MMVMVLISIYGHGHGHFLKEITMRAHQGRPLHLARDPLAYVALCQGSFAADRAHEFLFNCWRLRHRRPCIRAQSKTTPGIAGAIRYNYAGRYRLSE